MAGNWSLESEGPLGYTHAGKGYHHGARLATWPWRVAAGVIDYGITWFLPAKLLGTHFPTLTLWLVAILIGFNSGFMQGRTSQSLGKRILGLRTIRSEVDTHSGEPLAGYPGVLRCLLRAALHAVDAAFCFIGFLRPLWNLRRETWADSLVNTLVIRDTSPQLTTKRGARDR